MERTYFAGAWVELLGAGYEHDSETYRAWVAERIRRDFDAASIHRKDLGSTLGCGGARRCRPRAASSRGWEDEAVEQMALHLVELGLVSGRRPPTTRRVTRGS